ncbi:MAG TPA: hypothetical protein VKE74_19750 [Gemmataceae bacterium]|nr:hypothetical protein [Gemmataceae bacterium]
MAPRVSPSAEAAQPKPVAYYRLTPAVLAWLEWAGEQLEQRAAAPNARGDDVNQAAEFVLLMRPVWDFAREYLSAAEVSRARRRRPMVELPEVETGPAWDGPAGGGSKIAKWAEDLLRQRREV